MSKGNPLTYFLSVYQCLLRFQSINKNMSLHASVANSINKVLDHLIKTQNILGKVVRIEPCWLEFIFSTDVQRSSTYRDKFVPDHLKKQETCNEATRIIQPAFVYCPWPFQYTVVYFYALEQFRHTHDIWTTSLIILNHKRWWNEGKPLHYAVYLWLVCNTIRNVWGFW